MTQRHRFGVGRAALVCGAVGSWFVGVSAASVQDDLELLYQGAQITSVQPDQQDLTVRFTPPVGSGMTAADVTVVTVSNGLVPIDQLVLTLNNATLYFEGNLHREFGAPAIDQILQNQPYNDSVIVVWKNPDLPLDTLRISVPVLPQRNLTVMKAYYLDQSHGIADGYADVIRVVLGAGLTVDEVKQVSTYGNVHFSAQALARGVVIDTVLPSTLGFDVVLMPIPAANVAPFTGLYPSEHVLIDSVPGLIGGGGFPHADAVIQDSMGPTIVQADLYDLADPQAKDTLVVKFSEPVRMASSAQPFLLRAPNDTTTFAVSLSFLSMTADSLTVTFTTVLTVGGYVAHLGDSIWINPAASASDDHGVVQAKPNVKRLLNASLAAGGQHGAKDVRKMALVGVSCCSSRTSTVIRYALPASLVGVVLRVCNLRGGTLWSTFRANDGGGGVQSALWDPAEATREVCVLTMTAVDRSGKKAGSLTSVLTRLP